MKDSEKKVYPRYDYEDWRKRNRCPVCGGLGTPWRGWFTCEDCEAIALVKTGQVYLKAVHEIDDYREQREALERRVKELEAENNEMKRLLQKAERKMDFQAKQALKDTENV